MNAQVNFSLCHNRILQLMMVLAIMLMSQAAWAQDSPANYELSFVANDAPPRLEAVPARHGRIK